MGALSDERLREIAEQHSNYARTASEYVENEMARLRAVAREARAEALEEAALGVRAACTACKDGVFGWDGSGDAIECEYCGRPMFAIRALKLAP